ncbi:MAG TPA: DinB family protein, partial [Candidatus Acidoferrales bacterium]
MNPEQAKFLLGIYLSSLRREGSITRKVLAAVPRDKGSYRPHPNSRSALELAWHLASADIWFLDSFLAGQFSMEDDTMPADIADS